MTESHEQLPDSQLDEALRSYPPSSDLVDRIMTLTDGPMHELLDRALKMENEDVIVERILSQTTGRPPVLGRIEKAWGAGQIGEKVSGGWRAAAMVSIVGSLFVIIWTLSQPVSYATEFAAMQKELSGTLNLFDAVSEEGFDQELSQLSASLEVLAANDLWEAESSF